MLFLLFVFLGVPVPLHVVVRLLVLFDAVLVFIDGVACSPRSLSPRCPRCFSCSSSCCSASILVLLRLVLVVIVQAHERLKRTLI